MEIIEFAQKVRVQVERELGDSYRVQIREVRKNNGILLHGLLILSRSGNVTPTIYLETFHQAYEDGTTFAEVLRMILEVYRQETPKKNIDMEFFRDFDKVKDKICYRLVRQEGNEELLKDVPYVEFLDLAICFYYAYSGKPLGDGTILIHNSHMDLWKVNLKELMKRASENTPRLFPARCCNISDILRELGLETDAGAEREVPMNVLTNEKKIFGAACILYPGSLEEAAEKAGKNLYVIPSSVHEVILLEETGTEAPADLQQMICEVNRTQVAPEEVLSDHLYYYDRDRRTVKIIF